jgi:hypothetical protein
MSMAGLEIDAGRLVRRALAAAVLACLAAPAQAATLSFEIDEFSGDAASVRITLDDAAADGRLALTVSVLSGLADIRGVFFDVADDSLLAGLQVLGGAVTQVAFGDVIDLGNGANLNGRRSPCPCDVGASRSGPRASAATTTRALRSR